MAILEDPKESVLVPKTIDEQPGSLRNETRMIIQTREAQKLVVGRRGGKDVQPIMGLLNFGRRMKLLWMAAQADDPFADWFLLRIEESMQEARELIHEKRQWLDETLSSMEGFDISIASSLEPIQVHINFQNPYGYMGAYLIADYDALCRSVFTACHIGLMDRKTGNKIIQNAGRLIRKTFDFASRWKFTGVVREDVKVKSERALKAIALFGECPEPVLNKEKRAKISPEIRVKSKPEVTHKSKTQDTGTDNQPRDGHSPESTEANTESNKQKLSLKKARVKKKVATAKNESEKREAVAESLMQVVGS